MVALLDVTDVLDDPDFADVFDLYTIAQSVDDNGLNNVARTLVPAVSGVVQPAAGLAMKRMAEGTLQTDSIVIFTRTLLKSSANYGAAGADEIVWEGTRYVVVSVDDWSRYGAGYVKATCDMTQVNPP